MITARTGLLLDPYFSGTKIAWLFDMSRRPRPRRGAASWPSARSTAS
jgi:glycerol kinase